MLGGKDLAMKTKTLKTTAASTNSSVLKPPQTSELLQQSNEDGEEEEDEEEYTNIQQGNEPPDGIELVNSSVPRPSRKRQEALELRKSMGTDATEAFSELPPRSARLKPVDYSLSHQRIEYDLDYDSRPAKRPKRSIKASGAQRMSSRSTRFSGRVMEWDSTDDEIENVYSTSYRRTQRRSTTAFGQSHPTSVSHRYQTRTAANISADSSRRFSHFKDDQKVSNDLPDKEQINDDDDGPIRPRRSTRNRTSLNIDDDHEINDSNLQGNQDQFLHDDNGNFQDDNELLDERPYSLRSRGKRLVTYGEHGSGNLDTEDSKKQYGLRPRTEHKNYVVRIPLYGASPKKTERRRPQINRPRKFGDGGFGRMFSNSNGLFGNIPGGLNDSDDDRFSPVHDRRRLASVNADLRPFNYSSLDNSNIEKVLMSKRASSGKNLTDTDPLAIESSIDFSSVGGLDNHVKSLKEMVLLPLLYPEVFSKFGITPPRGVLFHGPPGTGKTLVARALANVCSTEKQKVAFFMRKGADVLSKWVGESERQLKTLFEQAKLMQPAIIFFDEIDGLAPVRSAKQDQIHSSIVTTLLALMDGLDSRGQVVVIAATNRIDAVDPALRRPGRFDRELYFPLPDSKARREIIGIHTRKWDPQLEDDIKDFLTESTQGYGGSDIKALVTEAALKALDRTFPQIYSSDSKLKINLENLHVTRADFERGLSQIIPSSYRWKEAIAKHLPDHLMPLLGSYLNECLELIKSRYPKFLPSSENHGLSPPPVYRPRLFIKSDFYHNGQSHISSAILSGLEHLRVHTLTLSALHQDPSITLENSVIRFLQEAKRILPAVLFIPNINFFWSNVSDSVRDLFLQFIDYQVEDDDELLIIASIDSNNLSHEEADEDYTRLIRDENCVDIALPSMNQRTLYFSTVLSTSLELNVAGISFNSETGCFECSKSKFLSSTTISVEKQDVELVPATITPAVKEYSDDDLKTLYSYDVHVFRKLRMILREFLLEIIRGKDYKTLTKNINDYEDVVKNDLHDILDKIESMEYRTVRNFRDDLMQSLESFGALVIMRDEYFKTTNIYAIADFVEEWLNVLDKSLISETEEAAERTKRLAKDYERILKNNANYKPYQLNFFKAIEDHQQKIQQEFEISAESSTRASRRIRHLDPNSPIVNSADSLENVFSPKETENIDDVEVIEEINAECEPNDEIQHVSNEVEPMEHESIFAESSAVVIDREEKVQEEFMMNDSIQVLPANVTVEQQLEDQLPTAVSNDASDIEMLQEKFVHVENDINSTIQLDFIHICSKEVILHSARTLAEKSAGLTVDKLQKKRSNILKIAHEWKQHIVKEIQIMLTTEANEPRKQVFMQEILDKIFSSE